MRLASVIAPAVGAALFACVGCGSPSKVNILLRKENQTLRKEMSDLKRAHEADVADMRARDAARSGEASATTLPSPALLDTVVTTHGLRIGKLTGGFDADASKPGDEMLKVYVVPTDRTGDLLKAAGSFEVEMFDLAEQKQVRLGHWEFSADETAALWYGQFLSYGYVLPCPWQTVPTHRDVTVKMSFTDTLTGRTFTEQKQISINPPG